MDTRRSFIRKSGMAAAACAIAPAMACGKKNPLTGLILYTVRQDMSRDPQETLAAVAAMGYNWIEAAGYSNGLFYGMKPAEFRLAVEGLGMKLISSHNSINRENADQVTDDAAEAGLKYLVLPSLPRNWSRSLDGFREAADFMNFAGEMCKSKGIKFGFHNHTVEFTDIEDVVPYDILAGQTDPALVTFQIDLCWATAAGKNPVDYIRKYPGRFELWHLKDMTPEKRDATMGEGIIDFRPIFDLKKISGLKYHFVEQDSFATHTPLESARVSREYLVNNLL
ncbi:MAG: sugar phosphate isomerase/epimerase [Bacteroidales bacterium]|jgi:sugar phosphate isomerase/epimerase|nr:sugar phosphate isomerase/epimerase [Bacteroidales bacterium]